MITLKYPIKVDGKEVKDIDFRRPKVKDMKKSSKMTKDESEAELLLFADLANLPVEAIEELDLWDYKVLQEEFKSFLPKTKSGN